jgi:hypothetical protein
MKMATTLIVVTLAVVGSNQSQDPAQASEAKSSVVISDAKLKELKGQDKTLASRSLVRKESVSRSRNTATIQVKLGTPNANKLYARYFIKSKYKWNGSQFKCLDALWQHESGWSHTADNPSSSAYGIPQSLPGHKMASEGADWKTNPATQIRWGAKYIKLRYTTPCGAYAHFKSKNWY